MCGLIIGLVGRVYLESGLAAGAEETVFMVMVGDLFPSLISGFYWRQYWLPL